MIIDGDVPAARLSDLPGFWAHWGFEPWAEFGLAGVRRRQRFVKSGLLGPVADYGAVDVIVWSGIDDAVLNDIWREARPLPDVLTQRYLVLRPPPYRLRRVRSFTLGFRGYLEFYAAWPGARAHKGVRDLTGLVDLALALPDGLVDPGTADPAPAA